MGLRRFLDRWGDDPAADSPCLKVCKLDFETRLCTGCKRSGAEIAGWSRMPRRERQAVLRALPGRLAQMPSE